MNREQRTKAMDAFKLDPACEVLLVSLRAGGVGLNLTAGRRVYLMEPFWNPAVENQAVGESHFAIVEKS
jgi:SWI/SNF-related matrix-associated actin-dependent regulator of chromatin subfamily A3